MSVASMPMPYNPPRKYVPASVASIAGLVLLLLAGLPVAVWLDLRNLSEHALRSDADELGVAINTMRNYYSQNVVGRVLQSRTSTQVVHNYRDIAGGIPIPATMSIELGNAITGQGGNVGYRFFSDYPFHNRAPHPFDDFEKRALTTLRQDPKARIYDISGSIFDRQIRVITPVVMSGECVACHNSHPDSPKRDWKIGDVRGLQEITIRQPITANIFAFKYLMLYLACAAGAGLAFIGLQRRQAAAISDINRQLEETNGFLARLSAKLAKYLPPQLYRSLFSGDKDVIIATERKKLTVFFSDIVNFAATTEQLQPEELTRLLNEYLSEMSAIATRHGGTVNKFIGDAMLVFFGDPDTKGVTEDAKAAVFMALEMQQRLAELDQDWRRAGIQQPFRARMGINSGYCNVGNFGSGDRMDYTIIGAEANLAARLQSIAPPGGIVLSYETYALVRDLVSAHPLPAITMKGISRPVVPYEVDGRTGEVDQRTQVISELGTGLDLFLDTAMIDDEGAKRARRALKEALAALDARTTEPGHRVQGGSVTKSGSS
jgi:class 3 adenylate cyclase